MDKTNCDIVILGLGSQAKAWALNLRDNKVSFDIALRKKSSAHKLATQLARQVIDIDILDFSNYSIVLNLIPDEAHHKILNSHGSKCKNGTSFFYAHGFSIIKHKLIEKFPHLNHILLAPKCIASELRFKFETNADLAAATSIEGAINRAIASKHLAFITKNIGITKTIECTVEQETLADLFSEQSLLCSILPYCALQSFNKLVQKGIPQKLAYLECWIEMKLIVDTLLKSGPEEFFKLISPNALIGGEKGRKELLGDQYNKNLDKLIDEVWSGQFFDEVDQTNYQEVQKDLVNFWNGQELTKIHNSWGSSLV